VGLIGFLLIAGLVVYAALIRPRQIEAKKEAERIRRLRIEEEEKLRIQKKREQEEKERRWKQEEEQRRKARMADEAEQSIWERIQTNPFYSTAMNFLFQYIDDVVEKASQEMLPENRRVMIVINPGAEGVFYHTQLLTGEYEQIGEAENCRVVTFESCGMHAPPKEFYFVLWKHAGETLYDRYESSSNVSFLLPRKEWEKEMQNRKTENYPSIVVIDITGCYRNKKLGRW